MYSLESAIVVVMMAAMTLLALNQPSRERQVVAGLFAGPIMLHDMVFSVVHQLEHQVAVAVNNSPFVYHFTGAAISYWTVVKLAELRLPPYLASRLQWVCAISIMYELAGWLMFRYAVPDELARYNALYIPLYAYAIIALIQGEPSDAGNNTTDDRFFVATGNAYQRSFVNLSH